jgi:hypothetical protein
MMEFWIQDTELVYCDGDAGVDVPNHETVVRVHVLQDIIGELESSEDSQCLEILSIMESHLHDGVPDIIAMKCDLNDCLEFDWSEVIADNVDYSEELLRSVFSNDFSGELDLRLWACEHLEWVRVVGNNVESWGFNRRQMKRAAWALGEIEGSYGLVGQLWNWEDRKTGKRLSLNLDQIENFNLTERLALC